jgi:lipopolysaccharide export system protein LptA
LRLVNAARSGLSVDTSYQGRFLNLGACEHLFARSRAPRPLRAAALVARRAVIGCIVALTLIRSAQAQIELPAGNLSDRVIVAADGGSHWTEGVYEVYLLRGNCYINQGLTYARSNSAVVWVERGGEGGEPPHKLIAYLEGNVEINYQQADSQGKAAGAATLKDKQWFGRFFSVLPIDVRPMKFDPPPAAKPDVYAHATANFNPAPAASAPVSGVAQPAQFAEPIQAPPPIIAPPLGSYRIRVSRRSAVAPEADAFSNPNTNEWVVLLQGGVNIVVDGVDQFGSIDVDTDNLVIWTEGALQSTGEGESVQAKDKPLEIYMEGNVVFRQGDRTIYAERMYYDVRRQTGTVLGAEILTPVPKFEGLMKLRAQVVQQTGPDRFLAQDASLTSSRFGVPGYELRSKLMNFQDVQHPRIDPATGTPVVDPSGNPVIDHEKMVTSRNNVVYLEQVPVFYWPYMATDMEQPNYYVDSVQFTSDRGLVTAF